MPNIAQLNASPGLVPGRVGEYAEIDMYGQHDEDNYYVSEGQASEVYVINVEDAAASSGDILAFEIVEGYEVSIVSSGTLATDLTALQAAIEADVVAKGQTSAVAIIDSDADTTNDSIQITMKVPGYEYEVRESANSTVTVTRTQAADFGAELRAGDMVFLTADGEGVTSVDPGNAPETDCAGIVRLLKQREDGVMDPRQDVVCIKKGPVWVLGGSTATKNQTVYLGNPGDATEKGQLFNAAGTGRVAIPKPYAHWLKKHVVWLNLPA